MLKKYIINYSTDVTIDIQSMLTKKIKTETYSFDDEQLITYWDDNDNINEEKVLEAILKEWKELIWFNLPTTIFKQYLSDSIKIKNTSYTVYECIPTIKEVIEHGYIDDLREYLEKA